MTTTHHPPLDHFAIIRTRQLQPTRRQHDNGDVEICWPGFVRMELLSGRSISKRVTPELLAEMTGIDVELFHRTGGQVVLHIPAGVI